MSSYVDRTPAGNRCLDERDRFGQAECWPFTCAANRALRRVRFNIDITSGLPGTRGCKVRRVAHKIEQKRKRMIALQDLQDVEKDEPFDPGGRGGRWNVPAD